MNAQEPLPNRKIKQQQEVDSCVYCDTNFRVLLHFEKYETTNYDVNGMRRYSWNMFQRNKNDMESTKMTTGDY